MLSDSPIDARGSQISPGLTQRSHGSSGSVAVELDGIAVRIAHIDSGGTAPPANGNTGLLETGAETAETGGRHGQPEVLEAAPARVEGAPRLDEVLPAGCLEEEHPRMWKGDPQPEHVRVEALGGAKIARLQREVAEPSPPGRRRRAHGRRRRAGSRFAFAARRAVASRSTVAASMSLLLFLFLPTLFLVPMTGSSVLQCTDACPGGGAHARSVRARSR